MTSISLPQFTSTRAIATTPEVDAMLARDCVVALGISGGKDGASATFALDEYLDRIGHAGPRVLIHAHLGDIEWYDALNSCERLARAVGWELVIVTRKAGGLLERWEQRWRNNVARYVNLECVKLILPWSTPAMRFCTSELKHKSKNGPSADHPRTISIRPVHRQTASVPGWTPMRGESGTKSLIAEAQGRCQVAIPDICTGRATEGHHRRPRGRGGKDVQENCVPTCAACHRFIHEHPVWAKEAGFLE